MIKLYYPDNLYSEKDRGQLFPLLKPFLKGENYKDNDRVKMYYISEKDVSLVNDIDLADILVLPMSWNYYLKTEKMKSVVDFIQSAIEQDKTVWSITTGDFGVKIPFYKNLVVFRVSGEINKLSKNNKGIPVFIEDPLVKKFNTTKVVERKYLEKPIIGFCGQTNSSFKNAFQEIIRVIIRNTLFYLGRKNELPQKIQSTTFKRSKVLSKIKKSRQLTANFIERNKYRAGAKSVKERIETENEFYNNMRDSDYVICIRGAGNFSVRLYETLAMGRIPIYINTDGYLPLSDIINWKEHMVWIEEDEIPIIEKKVLDFHKGMNEKSFNQLLNKNRLLWEENLVLGKFFINYYN